MVLLRLSKETENMRTKQLCSTAGSAAEKSAGRLAHSGEKDGVSPNLVPSPGRC